MGSKIGEKVIRDGNLLRPPRGVKPTRAFKPVGKYRAILVGLKRKYNKYYDQEVDLKYSRISGKWARLHREKYEEITGVFLRARKKVKKGKRAKKKVRKISKKNLKKKKNKNGDIVKMRRDCVKWKFRIVLNAKNMPGKQ